MSEKRKREDPFFLLFSNDLFLHRLCFLIKTILLVQNSPNSIFFNRSNSFSWLLFHCSIAPTITYYYISIYIILYYNIYIYYILYLHYPDKFRRFFIRYNYNEMEMGTFLPFFDLLMHERCTKISICFLLLLVVSLWGSKNERPLFSILVLWC